jgi:DNA-directed RNA polymerase subunit E'/Rpb7
MSTKEKRSKREKGEKEKTNIYTKVLLTRSVSLECKHINAKLTNTLLHILNSTVNGKCIDEGYVKPESINIVSYSSGIVKGNNVIFEVLFECMVCHLVEGMEILCIAKNITKAGIRAELNMDVSPIVIYVARDHHYVSQLFSKVREGDEIRVKIIGQRFELNDVKICAIAELLRVNPSKSLDLIEKIEESKSKSISMSNSVSPEQSVEQSVEPSEPPEQSVEPPEPPEQSVEQSVEPSVEPQEPSVEQSVEPPEPPEPSVEPSVEQSSNVEEVLGMEPKVETKTEPVIEKKKRGRPPKKKLVIAEDK